MSVSDDIKVTDHECAEALLVRLTLYCNRTGERIVPVYDEDNNLTYKLYKE